MSDKDVSVEIATEVTPELEKDVERLVPQVSSSAGAPTAAELEEIVSSPASALFLARLSSRGSPGPVVGMLTLVTYRIPTGLHAVIEDVVVEEAARGSGIGGLLVEAALEESRRRGARNVDLTSRPSREAANRLYQKMGFAIRETNVYRYSMR